MSSVVENRVGIGLIDVVEAAQMDTPYVHARDVENRILERLELNSQNRLRAIWLLVVLDETNNHCFQPTSRIGCSCQPWRHQLRYGTCHDEWIVSKGGKTRFRIQVVL